MTGFAVLLEPTWLAVLTGGIALILIVVVWLFATKFYIKPISPENRKDAVTILLQALGGAAFILGAWFTWQQLVNSRDELRVAQEGQITERFTRAVEQLGKTDEDGRASAKDRVRSDSGKFLAIRLGGIYALERMSKDPNADYAAIIDIFTAFVRQNAPMKADESAGKVKLDIQAILTVLGRRQRSYGEGESQRLDLSATDLSEASLINGKFKGANLISCRLNAAYLTGIDLNGAQLSDARLIGAFLERANLQGADLSGAKLMSADVTGADFSGANLNAVDLRGAVGLTPDQINSARSHAGLLTGPLPNQKP
jgi:Pentapeptide repeats (8 copies)